MLFLLLSIATAQHMLMPGGAWSYAYSSGEDAATACQTNTGYDLCYLNQLVGAAQHTDGITESAGWYRTSSGFARGIMQTTGALNAWAPEDGTGTAHCCMATYYNPGYNVGSNEYASTTTAEAACEAQDATYTLCTKRQVRGISEDGENQNQGQVSSVYADGSVGWYSGGQQSWDGMAVGAWPQSRGAHCCSPYAGYGPASIPNYGVLPESQSYAESTLWNADVASAACQDAGYDGLCTVAQQAQAEADGNGVCFVGWAYKEGTTVYTPGYWGNCGTANSWNDNYNPYNDAAATYPGAHCCKTGQAAATVAFPIYQTRKYEYQYSTVADANAQCTAFGSEYSLCSRGQLQRVATESFTYNGYAHTAETSICSLGWTRESSEDTVGEMTWYQTNAVDGCGAANSWNTIVGATDASFHCCQNFDGVAVPTPVYESRKWDYYNQEDAAAQCRDGASLCSRDQLYMVATESFNHNGVDHIAVADMCSQGWTSDFGLVWYQAEVGEECTNVGWNAFAAPEGTFHCCTDFSAPSSSLPYESRAWFEYTEADASAMCNSDQSLCTAEQVYRAATEDFTYAGMDHVAVTNMCSQGWTSNMGLGWYQHDAGSCGDGSTGWRSFTADTGTYHCCMDFDGLTLPTDAPESTDAPVTDAPVTDAPESTTTTTAPIVSSMPSSETMTNPDGCVAYDFAPEGFSGEVSYCVADGMVYLGGYSTCILVDEDTSALNTALQNSWNNDWYFGTSQDCTARTDDATTDDQLWVTNKMCDNLEADIAVVETSMDSYMDDWTQQVTDLVNANMNNFDQATQDALTAYLQTLNGGN